MNTTPFFSQPMPIMEKFFNISQPIAPQPA
jgi:hypothetical protein